MKGTLSMMYFLAWKWEFLHAAIVDFTRVYKQSSHFSCDIGESDNGRQGSIYPPSHVNWEAHSRAPESSIFHRVELNQVLGLIFFVELVVNS